MMNDRRDIVVKMIFKCPITRDICGKKSGPVAHARPSQLCHPYVSSILHEESCQRRTRDQIENETIGIKTVAQDDGIAGRRLRRAIPMDSQSPTVRSEKI
jgi:hypothetical protein